MREREVLILLRFAANGCPVLRGRGLIYVLNIEDGRGWGSYGFMYFPKLWFVEFQQGHVVFK